MSLKVTNQPETPINTGYGEYIVYHQTSTGEKVAPSRATYESAYAVMNHFNSPSTDNRYATVRSKIKAIDPSLEITFVPRTYYEMQFLKKGIKEDLARNDFCNNEKATPNPYAPNNTHNCWHIGYFDKNEDNNAEAIKVLAYNLNQNILKKLKKQPLDQFSLKFKTLSAMTDKQIQFFRKFHDTFDLWQKRNQGQFTSYTFSEGTPMQKFSKDGSMSIRNDADAKIVQNAIALECSTIAEKTFLLYRGSEFPTDLPYSPQNTSEPYSYSFGSGLFAGALYREGATAEVYMKSSEDGYVMVVPAEEAKLGVFDIPQKHTLCHLTSNNGVIFHPRTRIWKTEGQVWGFDGQGNNKNIVQPYFCNLDRETLTDRVLNFKNRNVIFLKSLNNPVLAVPSAFQPIIHIRCTVPFGKNLYIRGSGAGLNWNRGQPLVQIAEDHWVYRLSQNFDKLEYKVLIDDTTFEEGSNHKLESGKSTTEAPYFNVPSTPSPQNTTRLTIRYNAGMGNTLSIRGGGPGLDWNQHTPLKNAGEDLWIWETSQHFTSFEYKLVVNNKWESGPNHRVQHGKKEEVLPRF